MGASISSASRHRSTPADTLSNMITAIGDVNRWDNDATNVKAAVTQSIHDIIKHQSLVKSPTSSATPSASFFKQSTPVPATVTSPQSPSCAFDLSNARRLLREIERLFDSGHGGVVSEAAAFPLTPSSTLAQATSEYCPAPSLFPLIAPASKLFTQVALAHAAMHKHSDGGSRAGSVDAGRY